MPFFTAPNVYLFKHNNRLYHNYNFVKDDLMRIPKECRRHPFQPYDAPMDNVFGKRCLLSIADFSTLCQTFFFFI